MQRTQPFTRPSARLLAVQSPVIPLVAELIRANPGTISLGQGVVHYPPPHQVFEELRVRMVVPENHKYGPVTGTRQLLELVREKLLRENGIRLHARRHVVITAGANMAFMNAVLAVANPGDEIIIQTPYYFNHEMAIAIAGCTPVLVATDDAYQLRLGAIREAVTDRTRAVVTVSPNNPTGAVYRDDDLWDLNDFCREAGLYHIHDSAYEYFAYDGARVFSPGSIDGAEAHTISLFSLSKAYGFASWRIGYMVVPDHLLDAVKKIQDTILICPPMASQVAAMGALRAGSGYCRRHVGPMAEVRGDVLRALAELGDRIVAPEPRGAFYVFVRVKADVEPWVLVRRLIEEFQVAVIPGSTFGVDTGCTFRLSYGALERPAVAKAMDRLVEGVAHITDGG